MIEAIELSGVLRLRLGQPTGFGEALQRLGWLLSDMSEQISARPEALSGVALECGGSAFYVDPPSRVEDCDASIEWRRATSAIVALAPPTVAVIEGDAIGPAWELALACDLRICASEARLGSPEIRWGRIPSAGGTQRLARLAGPGRALWLLLRGEIVSGEEALRLGLVHRAVPRNELAGCVEDVLERLRASAPIALAYAKEAVKGAELPLLDGLRLEADLAALLQTTADRAEGIRSFLERRPPEFQGR